GDRGARVTDLAVHADIAAAGLTIDSIGVGVGVIGDQCVVVGIPKIKPSSRPLRVRIDIVRDQEVVVGRVPEKNPVVCVGVRVVRNQGVVAGGINEINPVEGVGIRIIRN